VEFLQLCIKSNCSSFLDFGSGIGSSGILFGKYGFKITLADISDAMLNYSKWRLARHDISANFIDLKTQILPQEYFDCVTAIEILEHTIDPVKIMSSIAKSLKIGGYAFVTTPFYFDPDRPQHLVHDMNVANKFEELNLKLISKSDDGLYRVYEKI
jgi:2-polyprenyl-6-hydroxyphenyl methylase/3-demethylubiquinone-9 3-methyltransferase